MVERAGEQRRRLRVRTRRTATIKWSDNPNAVRCVLWDHSESGARIAAPYANTLPAVFTLINDQTCRVCRVIWRKGPLVGVRFVAATESEELARIRSARPQQAEPAGPPPDTLMLSTGARAIHDSVEHKDLPVSVLALGFLLVLIALTVVFYFAGRESGSGSVWAAAVCREGRAMCQHPEFGTGASVLMALVYFAVRGME